MHRRHLLAAASAASDGRTFRHQVSVRKAGDRVRIGVQLTDAADGVPIWTHRTENIDSYDLCLRALPLFRVFSRAETQKALELPNRTIALDPDHGPALALETSCHRTIVIYGWSDDPGNNRRQGPELAHRALKIAGDDATVLAGVANGLAFLTRDADALLKESKQLSESPGCHAFLAASHGHLGERSAALEALSRHRALTPVSIHSLARSILFVPAGFKLFLYGITLAKVTSPDVLS